MARDLRAASAGVEIVSARMAGRGRPVAERRPSSSNTRTERQAGTPPQPGESISKPEASDHGALRGSVARSLSRDAVISGNLLAKAGQYDESRPQPIAGMETATLVRYSFPIKIVVLNNGGVGPGMPEIPENPMFNMKPNAPIWVARYDRMN